MPDADLNPDDDALYQEFLKVYLDLRTDPGGQKRVLHAFLYEWGEAGRRKKTAGEAMRIALERHGIACRSASMEQGAEEYEEILAAQDLMRT